MGTSSISLFLSSDESPLGKQGMASTAMPPRTLNAGPTTLQKAIEIEQGSNCDNTTGHGKDA
ncbi:unnamed protein product [Prunus armeniaca]